MNTQKVRESTSFYERSFQTSNYYYFPFFVHPEEKSRKIRASAGGNRRSTFAYDVNGNVTNDATNSLQTSYNLINLPVQTKSGSTVKANYSYLSDGSKASVLNASGTGYDYNSTFTYSHASGGTRTLESVAFGGGRIRKNGSSYAVDYYVTDHLGSVRAIVNASGAIVEQNDYYPFGTRQQNGLTPLSTNRWRFSGKEGYDSTFGIALDDFGARLYDRTAWTSIDPLAEKYYSVSPYSYCAGNPVSFVDPEGMFSLDTGLIEEGDNLTEITNMINAAFSLNLSIEQIAKSNNIDNINNIRTGSYIILPGRNVSLLFDLKHLQVMDNTYGVALEKFTWEGTSGRFGCQSPEYQSQKNLGPIPEGYYSVNPNDTQYFSDLSNFQRIKSRFALGEWPGGKSSWGNSRTWIFPNNGTNTYGRSGFSIHGGSTPGSAGCIDLTSK